MLKAAAGRNGLRSTKNVSENSSAAIVTTKPSIGVERDGRRGDGSDAHGVR